MSAPPTTTASCACGSCSRPEPDKEDEVRHLIEQALSGQLKFPDGFTTPWQLRASWPSEISAEETGHAKLLIRS